MSHSSNRGSESFRDESRYRERDSRKSEDYHSQKRKESNYKEEERPSKRLDSKSYSDSTQQIRDITQVDWKEHQKFLDNLFFKKSDIIQFNTPQYNDFWSFFDKYIAFRRRKLDQQMDSKEKAPESSSTDVQDKTGPLGLPSRFDERYTLNFAMLTDKPSSDQIRFHNKGSTDFLSENDIREFRNVLHLYYNFLQKKAFDKMKKIREDRQSLPIFNYRDQILQTVKENQVVVIAGDTGCGKSTQVPQYLMEGGYSNIAVTQPRRIATMSLSRRVGYETFNEYGSQIAYQIRFESSKAAETKILFLTEGLLLRQLATDSLLQRYNIIIVDEVHERHIHCDFLLGILKSLLMKRPDLKLILMSATINIDLFSNYFNKAPIITVPGRLYPIQIEFLPIPDEERVEKMVYKGQQKEEDKKAAHQVRKRRRINPKPYIRILERIDQAIPNDERGDLLIFVSGMEDIMSLAEEIKLSTSSTKNWIVLPLHSSLSIDEQDKVFDTPPEGVRKCIISTNIAETSVTIDGIRFVIDSGKVKEMAYDSVTKMQKLQEFWISKASSEQRKGRAGRTGPGICYRFYGPQDYSNMEDFAVPEIHRIPLESIILQIKALNLGDPRVFPFIETPPAQSIEESILTLKRIEAITDDTQELLTPMGLILSKLPVEVHIGKMLVLSTVFDVVETVLTISAALSLQSPFVRTNDEATLTARNKFTSDQGDTFTLLQLYNEWVNLKANTRDNTRKWCKRHGVEEQRLYEITKLREQFRDLLRDCRLIDSGDSKEGSKDSIFDIFEQRKGKTKKFDRSVEIKRKQLRILQLERSKNRKRVLTMEKEIDDEKDSDEEESEIDFRDIDFRLTHSEDELRKESENKLSKKQVNIVKMIVASGFYPNVSIPDEYNANHKESDQIFHTQFKQFATIHPTSVFYGRSVFIQPDDVLFYEKLLETNKPYVTNAFRASSLHYLLLIARTVDTNKDCSRYIIDNWLDIQLDLPFLGVDIIQMIIKLRSMLYSFLYKKLVPKGEITSGQAAKSLSTSISEGNAEYAKLPNYLQEALKFAEVVNLVLREEEFHKKLAEFLEVPIKYKFRRLKHEEINSLFKKAVLDEPEVHESKKEKKELDAMQELEAVRVSHTDGFEENKSGIKVNGWLRYGSILEADERDITAGFNLFMKKQFHCVECGGDFKFNLDELKEHLQEHKKKKNPNAPKISDLANRYYCEICKTDFMLTNTEVLKHKKQHGSAASEKPEPAPTVPNFDEVSKHEEK